METIGFVGGTGPQGRGLSLRLGQAGCRVLLGSRDVDRAAEAAEKVVAKDPELDLRGVSNRDACAGSEVVVVTVPAAKQADVLPELRTTIGEKLVISCMNALSFDEQGPRPVLLSAGSAAEECQRLLPDARVVGAFQNVAAGSLLGAPDPVEGDVLVCGDDDVAAAQVGELVGAIPGMRSVQAGPLRLARPIEEITAVLLSLNRRLGARTGLRITGI